MTDENFAAFKARQREMWSSFAPRAILTTPVAAHLVKFAGVQSGERLLDVACGTGVVTITAARAGARVWLADVPEQLNALREEFYRLAEPCFRDNLLHQSYLLTRANAK